MADQEEQANQEVGSAQATDMEAGSPGQAEEQVQDSQQPPVNE